MFDVDAGILHFLQSCQLKRGQVQDERPLLALLVVTSTALGFAVLAIPEKSRE